MIVAPWWKWANHHDTNSGRVSRPVFQKYDTGDMVNAFLKQPQRCLTYLQEDLVHHVQSLAPVTGLGGKPRRFADKAYVPDGTNTRKIFRDTHRRFYLVVCQVHCDGPGFPRAAREKVCEAGFVVRRRTTRPPTASVPEGTRILRQLTSGRQQLARVESELSSVSASEGRSGLRILDTARTRVLLQQKSSVRALIEVETGRLQTWIRRFGIVPEVQGWFKHEDGRDKVGAWKSAAETPDALGLERTFPMYPLIAPKNDADHEANFGTIYFGVLPTATGETTERGEDRFDDQTYYEVRCFVRRHKVPHDAGSKCQCPDRLFWSVPSEPYKIAAHFDLTGTSKRPVTVQLPDLNELAAQAKPVLGVAFQKPPGYPMVGGTPAAPAKLPSSPSFQICSFPIVLITIVATFVFELFLPIVMIVFQLWWMLAFKFCIPPEISLSAGLNAELALDASIAFEAGIEASIDANIDANFPAATEPAINAELKNNWAPIAVGNLQVQLAKASTTAASPTVSGDVQWEAEVPFS